MPTETRPSGRRHVLHLRRLPLAPGFAVLLFAALYAMVGGAVTLLGWLLNRPRLTDWGNTGISMFANAALCAGLCGAALLLLARINTSRWRLTAVRVLGSIVAIIGGLTLLEHLFGVTLGIDTLLFPRPWGQRAAAAPMRMGPPASFSFLILGCGLLLASGGPRARRVAAGLALLPIAVSSLSLIGYGFGADQLYTAVHLTAIALQTSSMIAALAIGLTAAVPEYGIAGLLRRDDPGGMLVRRLLLAIIAVPLLMGWLRLRGQQAGFYDTAFGVSMTSLGTIAMLLGLLAWTGLSISQAARATRESRDELEAVLKKDIADRKLAEQALREREQRYELVLKGAEAAIWDWDVPQKRVMYSPRWKELRGLSDAEVTDSESEWIERIHPEDRERVMTAVQAHFDGLTHVFNEEYRVQHKDGRWVWILDRGIARRDETGAVTRMAGSETDITERKRAEDELRQAEARMRSVVDHVVDGIITIDESGRIQAFNPAAEVLFGYEAGDVIGENVKVLAPEPHRAQNDRDVQAFLDTGLTDIIGIGREVVGRRKDGSDFPMELAVSTFELGSQRYFTGIVRDITQRKQLEEQLRQRVAELDEADRRKNEFLATLAHELRNPLAPISNALHLWRIGGRAAVDGLQEILERQVNHMVRLVDDLLEISRINSGKIDLRPENVDLHDVLQTAVEISRPLISAGGHQFETSLPQEPLRIIADPMRLSQVVANLLNNAAKYTEPGGRISLSTERENGDVLIRVRDTGMGISADMLPQVFRMFSQADKDHKRAQGGLGIGLALAKGLVDLHGGRIEAHSEGEGRGSEFLVRLPLAESQPSPSVNGQSACLEGNHSSGRRVLVVDDNKDAAFSLGMLLTLLGHEVRTVNDGPAALREIAEFSPSAVLLDLGMPGMSGYEVAQRVRAMTTGNTPALIALTGWGQEEDRQRSRDAGFDHHMVKPVDITELKTLLSDLPESIRGTARMET